MKKTQNVYKHQQFRPFEHHNPHLLTLLPVKMQLILSTSFVFLATTLAAQAFPGLPLHPRADAGGVVIVPPPNLSNQTGTAQIPGN